MLDQCHTACGETATSGLALRTVWEVDAGPRYSILGGDAARASLQIHPLGAAGLIAIRSLSGQGSVLLRSDREYPMGAGHLLVTEWNHLTRYRCSSAHWRFWWFEFTLGGAPDFPLHERIDVPPAEGDEALFREACDALSQPASGPRRLASAAFALLLRRWLAHHEDRQADSRQVEALREVICRIQECMDRPWTVGEMARIAHMSERHFRNVFRDYTGQSPKQFHNELRLNMAMQHLRGGTGSIAEIACRFGYCSPFHFSRAFRKRFGLAPSQVRP